MQRPVSIIGAGIGGLSLGQCLRSRGIPAILFDKHNGGKRYDYGMTLDQKTYEPLLKRMKTSKKRFREQMSVVENHEALRANRWALEEMLREGLEIRWRHAVKFVTPSGTANDEVVVHFDNGERMETKVVVAADGAHSPVRGIMLPNESSLKVLPYVVYNGRRRLAWSECEKLGLDAAFSKLEGVTHLIGSTRLNVSAAGKDGDRVNISYTFSRPATTDDQALLGRSVLAAEDKQTSFLEELHSLGPLPTPFKESFDPSAVKQDRITHWLMRSNLLDPATLERTAKEGHVAFLGDAVHALPILGGQGANAAMEDAVQLADCFSRDGQSIDTASFYASRHSQWATLREEAETALESMHFEDKTARL
ncbi:hypothetical protein MBLNU230_g6831t1 [Neophaeotheca triangularis]